LLSVNDLKGLLEVNRIAVIPFIVAAYINEFNFSHFPAWVNSHWFLVVLAFILVVIGSFLLSWFMFDLTLYADYYINSVTERQLDIIYSVATVSLISFGILGFFLPEPFSHIKLTWFIASGACGLYLLDIQRKTQLELNKNT